MNTIDEESVKILTINLWFTQYTNYYLKFFIKKAEDFKKEVNFCYFVVKY